MTSSLRAIPLAGMLWFGILLAPTPSQAQGAVRLGIQGGLNFANLRGADAEGTELTTGWSLGATARLGSGRVSLMPGLILTQKGATESGPGFSSTLAVRYLQVPALIRIRLSAPAEVGAIGTFFFAGPAVGLKVSCSVSSSGGFSSASSSCEDAAGDDPDVAQFSSSEVSGVAGFGAEIASVSIAVQYELGLSRIADNLDIKTRTISAVVRYFFGGSRPDPTLSPRLP